MDEHELRSALVKAIELTEGQRARFQLLLDGLDGEDAVQVPRQGRWTRTMVARLWHDVRHLPGIKALFEVAAAHENEVVTYTQLLAASKLDTMQQRNEHARMSRIASTLFGDKRWPIENWQGPAGPDGVAGMRYRMGATVAQWWREIADQ